MNSQAFARVTRKPRRMTISVPEKIFMQLVERSDSEGRSMSNLSAFLLEQALIEYTKPLPPQVGVVAGTSQGTRRPHLRY